METELTIAHLSEHSSLNLLHVLFIEPFYGGSHREFINTLSEGLNDKVKISLFTLPSKKWHWRARTSALYFYDKVPKGISYDIIFATSVLNLAEFLALRPDLTSCKKILFFHENQLAYPIQRVKERDFQYGYNQILSCLVADIIIFNSNFNMSSFISNIDKFFKLQPDHRPKGLKEVIAPKCQVLHVPLKLPTLSPVLRDDILHIVWPHRWEHDKNPELFFKVVSTLKDQRYQFFISVVGKASEDNDAVFEKASESLKDYIKTWGFLASKEDYYKLLQSCHVAVSTAKHEFFGISMLEAANCGCFPLCPKSLVYPEIFPEECLYKDENKLTRMLMKLCKMPHLAVKMRDEMKFDITKFSTDTLMPKYECLFSKS